MPTLLPHSKGCTSPELANRKSEISLTWESNHIGNEKCAGVTDTVSLGRKVGYSHACRAQTGHERDYLRPRRDRNRFSSSHTTTRRTSAPFSAIPALRLLGARPPELDCHFALAVGLAFLTLLTCLTSDTSQPLFDPKNKRLTAPRIWLSACLWSTRG